MNQINAMRELLKQASSVQNSLASYKRACKALRALGFNAEDSKDALGYLGYLNYSGEPYEWLARKLADKP